MAGLFLLLLIGAGGKQEMGKRTIPIIHENQGPSIFKGGQNQGGPVCSHALYQPFHMGNPAQIPATRRYQSLQADK